MRVLLIGCGSIGMRHLRNLKSLRIENLMAFDTVADRREHAQQECGARPFDSLDAALRSGADVAFVTTPTHLHVPIALQAARAGCHLFIEKPLSHTLEGIGDLLKEIDSRCLISLVGCNMRFHPGPATVKRLLGDKVVGEVIAARIQTGSFLPRWRPWQDYRQSYSASPEWGGAILDCIHEIDLALWYFGPANVVGAACLPAKMIGLEADGLAEIILCHESGMLSNVHLNFVQRDYRRTCQVIGSQGTIYWDFSNHQVVVYGADGQLARSLPEPDGWQVNQMYVDEMAHFLQAVQTGSQTVNPISGGLAALHIALTAKQMSLERCS